MSNWVSLLLVFLVKFFIRAEPCKSDIKESVSRKVCGPGSIKRECNAKTRVNKLERPKTRRNEAG